MAQQLALIPRPVEVEVLPPEPVEAGRPTPADFARMLAAAVVAAQEPARLTEREKEYWYPQAFAEWLANNPRTGDPRPAATINAYQAAWEDFRLFCPKRIWLVEGLDVRAWVDDLKRRSLDPSVAKGLVKNGRRREGQLGLSPSTVNQYISAISAFYSFAEGYEVRAADGRTVPLYDGLNPAKSQIVKRPKTRAFDEVTYLAPEHLRALLQAIRSYAPLNGAKSLRDYALFLTYISTAARNSEIRVWQWRHLVRRGVSMYYTWRNKGKSGTDELPAEAWDAVQDYLTLTGRLNTIQADDYIFTPLGDSVKHLKRSDGTPVVDPDAWTTNRPLSMQEINRCLRFYARRAGLADVDRLHVHCLRHSASMLYLEAGLPVEELSGLLHHSSLNITTHYVHQVQGKRNVGWAQAANLLRL